MSMSANAKIIRKGDRAVVSGFDSLDESLKRSLRQAVADCNPTIEDEGIEFSCNKSNLREIGRLLSGLTSANDAAACVSTVGQPIDFAAVNQRAQKFNTHLRTLQEDLWNILSPYETWDVLLDEMARVDEYLTNLEQTKEWFKTVAPPAASFLPLNQPLYALVCYVLVPSLMCDRVYVRAPSAMTDVFRELVQCLKINEFFPNVEVFDGSREAYIAKTRLDVKTVNFVGSTKNCDIVRQLYPSDVLFLANGAGQNPVLVMKDADLSAAVCAVMRVLVYNQGQDCAAPNAVLVHKDILEPFKEILIRELKNIDDRVGINQAKNILIKANTDEQHAVKMAKFYVRNKAFGVYGGQINPLTGLIHPSVFIKPLSEGANYDELFAPVFFIQPFETEAELEDYFFSKEYRDKAMYVTIFGSSEVEEKIVNAGIHSPENVIHDMDLHEFEKGYKPYGGNGREASCIYYKGQEIPSAIHPPREISKYTMVGV